MKLWLRMVGAALCVLTSALVTASAQTSSPLSERDAARAAEDYERYCALCHGPEREGYANDHAPSLKSGTLLFPGNRLFLFRSIAYGRPDTAMAAYREESGGPMSNREIFRMVDWLYAQEGVDPRYDEDGNDGQLPYIRIEGDVDLGRQVYARECASCHGASGEGGTGTALSNPVMLIFASDLFLKRTIEEGRENTPMLGFKDKLTPEEIDGVTAFLRSKAGGADLEQPGDKNPPTPDEYVINADGADPEFTLEDEIYISSEQLNQALEDKRRMVILDTRAASWWRMGHIEGAVPIPYYSDFDDIIDDLPRDVWIVGYCECPRALAAYTIRQLHDRGFEKTAVLWEGIQGWAGLGYPVILGRAEEQEAEEE
ncbi:c-type cytochrome [Hyphococcus flavus]|uniref:C-type cytochrome n=1 Tax=Hyphococcus flavus TaxID=1866326 RepID=A0AAE9ZK43_9PROT|nr:c-type cytochrome [Hyphococcus flavus]WDI32616.1 c-type cytochrome [Hyphococcus flavus]